MAITGLLPGTGGLGWPDVMKITEAHRRKLCELIYWAFLEMRQLGWAGEAKQVADLADAFHNLPKDMWKEDFSLEFFRDAFLMVYQQKYPEGRVRDYVGVVNEMLAQGEDYGSN